ncbi:U1 small nuclear ribonucleoprotein C [Ceratocystis lukuohia]|uniref:U1 small nuclear ribonucleoprotein C n=1 Tax=Ceratocystis lukuohia TaxID=2019550 RepID=A0ABR4MR36_9PEZI
MPKFFCDYCDVYLTHDSMSVRKAHNSGRNHIRNVVDYYEHLDIFVNLAVSPALGIGHEKAQSVIDSITSSYAAEGQAHNNPMLPHNQPGGGFPGGGRPAPYGFPGGVPPPFPGAPGAFPPGVPPPPGVAGRGLPPNFPIPGPNGLPPLPNGLPFPPPGGLPFPPPIAGAAPGSQGPPKFPPGHHFPPPGVGAPPAGVPPPFQIPPGMPQLPGFGGFAAPGMEKR